MGTSRALVIGMDFYDGLDPIPSAALDAETVSDLLRLDWDQVENFEVTKRISTEDDPLTAEKLLSEIDSFFDYAKGAELLFYFSGHAQVTNFGLQLATADKSGSLDVGIPFDSILNRANSAEASFITVILDCCFAGAAANAAVDAHFDTALVRENIAILASSRGDRRSYYGDELSDYTQVIVDGLRGAAADLKGEVTPLGLHELAANHPDLNRNGWPVIKTHASSKFTIRRARQSLLGGPLAADLRNFDLESGALLVREDDSDAQTSAIERLKVLGLLDASGSGDGSLELSHLGRYWSRRFAADSS